MRAHKTAAQAPAAGWMAREQAGELVEGRRDVGFWPEAVV